MPSTLEILTALKTALAAITLRDAADADNTAGDSANDPAIAAPLFETVEFAANKQLGTQLRDLLVTRDRVCLIVPFAVRRTISDETGALSVLGRKHLAVELLYSDRALFKSGQTATFGGEKNLGLLGFDDRLEAALTGRDLSPFGGLILGDSEPLLLTDTDQARIPDRHAWLVSLLLPTGLIAAPTL